MEVYNFPHGHADAYPIQGAQTNPQLASPLIEQFETMYNEVAPEIAVQQGLYYPTATNYGYIYTGLESPADWEDHQRIFGLDGQEIQYSESDNFLHVYYTPNYGYPESLYNPYNPYIPGAMIGIDAPYMESQLYYSAPSYENSVSSRGYYPIYVQSQPDIHLNSTVEPFVQTSAPITNRSITPGLKHNLSSASAAFTLNPSKFFPNQTNSLTRGPDGSKVGAGPSKQPLSQGILVSSGFSSKTSSSALQGRGSQAVDNTSPGKVWSSRHQFKVAPPSTNDLSSLGLTAHGRSVVDKVQPNIHVNKTLNDASISSDALSEQNRGPKTNKSKNQLAVKAYTSNAGNSDAQGNIVISTDQYNKDDFPVDYVNAKFFVIKSYSEDDVHKSVKYNVWSSTPNGNKKLNIAYDDAQRLAAMQPRGCPVFLFFSVNASGQFCGVAEMIGMVDFHKDMDFWQQDKWCGSFPIKWHIIKDVPNPNFRHIILENNENKPVTNSRDTQEIRYKKGMEMLKIFKNFTSKTSLFDDFLYYENRQKLLQEEKARLLIKSFENPFLIPSVEPQCKLNDVLDLPPNAYGKKNIGVSSSEKNASISPEQVSLDKNVCSVSSPKENGVFVAAYDNTEEGSLLKIGSLSSINSKPTDMKTSEGTAAIAPTRSVDTAVNAGVVDVLTVGSMPVKVNGLSKSAGFLTFGTIPLDPRALQVNAPGHSFKSGSRKG